MSRVVLDLVPIRPGKGGTGSGIWIYALELVRHLDQSADADGLELHCLINRQQRAFFSDLRRIRCHVIPNLGSSGAARVLWIHFALPVFVLLLRARVLHKLATETPLFCTAQRVTTVNDFISEFMQENAGGPTGPGDKRWSSPASRYFRWVTGICFRKSDAVITISEAVRADALRRFPKSRARITAVHDGVSWPPASRPAPDLSQGAFTVLCVAKFMRYKGQMQALLAFEQLLADHPDVRDRARLVMHGFDNDPDYLRSIRDRIAQSGLQEKVFIRPYHELHDISEIYRDAHVFLFLTQYEGFGLPVVESQVLGIPVVCSDIPALREVGADAAIYVDREDPKSVAGALYKLFSDSSFYGTLQDAGRRNVLRFDWRRTAKETVDVYREVLTSMTRSTAC